MTILMAKTRMRVTYCGDLPGGWLVPRRWTQSRLGWGPIPMLPVPRWVARLAIKRLRKLARR